tara:strand:- start:320 stop:739 length:420 start_codon:yes stop_codon:yes gene_type:complete
MSITANPKKTEQPKVDIVEDDDTPEYQEMIMFYISNFIRASLTLWCLLIITLAYIKLPSKIFGMDWPEQRIDATYSAGLLGNLLASYGISIGGMGKKKKRENGESQNSNGSSGNDTQTQTIRVEQPLIIRTEAPTTTTK